MREFTGTGEFPAQRPVTRKMFPFDDVIMNLAVTYWRPPKQRGWREEHKPTWRQGRGGVWRSTPSTAVYNTPGADSRFASRQWETALLCNDVSYWLGANLKSALILSPCRQPLRHMDTRGHCNKFSLVNRESFGDKFLLMASVCWNDRYKIPRVRW